MSVSWETNHDGQPPAGCRFNHKMEKLPLRSPLSQSLIIPSLLMKDLHHSDEKFSAQIRGDLHQFSIQ